MTSPETDQPFDLENIHEDYDHRPRTELLLSNLSLPKALAATVGLVGLREEFDSIHDATSSLAGIYDGYEITPTRMLELSYINRGSLHVPTAYRDTGSGVGMVRRLHQTWPPDFREVIGSRRSAFNLAAYATMRSQSTSVQSLFMQHASLELGKVPLTAYAESGSSADGGTRDFRPLKEHFSSVEVQPTPDTFRSAGQSDPRRISLEAIGNLWAGRGIDAAVVDCAHLLRASEADPEYRISGEKVMEEWAADPAILAIGGLHVAVGRVDMKQEADQRRSMEELRALRRGPEAFAKTEAGGIIVAAAEIWSRQQQAAKADRPAVLQMVIETPYDAYMAMFGRKLDRIAGYEELALLGGSARVLVDKVLADAA